MPNTTPKKSAAATLIAAMVAVATPVYVSHEGEELTAYRDVVNVLTICSGDTRNVVEGMKLTPEQCKARTAKILTEFGDGVAKMSPGIEASPYEWAAHTSFAANVGLGNYSKSGVRRLYNQGEHRQACRYMRKYRLAGGRVFQGLVNRREGTDSRIGEYELCLVGAIPEDMD